MKYNEFFSYIDFSVDIAGDIMALKLVHFLFWMGCDKRFAHIGCTLPQTASFGD